MGRLRLHDASPLRSVLCKFQRLSKKITLLELAQTVGRALCINKQWGSVWKAPKSECFPVYAVCKIVAMVRFGLHLLQTKTRAPITYWVQFFFFLFLKLIDKAPNRENMTGASIQLWDLNGSKMGEVVLFFLHFIRTFFFLWARRAKKYLLHSRVHTVKTNTCFK